MYDPTQVPVDEYGIPIMHDFGVPPQAPSRLSQFIPQAGPPPGGLDAPVDSTTGPQGIPSPVIPQAVMPAPMGYLGRFGAALRMAPQFQAAPYMSSGQGFFGGLMSGVSGGLQAYSDQSQKAEAQKAQSTNTANTARAAFNNAVIMDSIKARIANEYKVAADDRGKVPATAQMLTDMGIDPKTPGAIGKPMDPIEVSQRKVAFKAQQSAEADRAAKTARTIQPGDVSLVHGAVGAKILTPQAGESLLQGMTGDERREVMLKSVPGAAQKETSGDVVVSPSAQKIVDQIATGNMRPDILKSFNTRGDFRNQVAVGLATKGIDINTMQFDIGAETRYWSTQNDSKRTSMRTLLNTLDHSIPYTRNLVEQYKKQVPDFGIHGLNAAALTAVANTKGPNGVLAQKVLAQIADISGEVGGLYMGGNSNTDESFRVAKQNLDSSWNEDQLLGGLDQIQYNAGIRKQSMVDVTPITRTSQRVEAARKFWGK